jgi:hypothetical protein
LAALTCHKSELRRCTIRYGEKCDPIQIEHRRRKSKLNGLTDKKHNAAMKNIAIDSRDVPMIAP